MRPTRRKEVPRKKTESSNKRTWSNLKKGGVKKKDFELGRIPRKEVYD